MNARRLVLALGAAALALGCIPSGPTQAEIAKVNACLQAPAFKECVGALICSGPAEACGAASVAYTAECARLYCWDGGP